MVIPFSFLIPIGRRPARNLLFAASSRALAVFRTPGAGSRRPLFLLPREKPTLAQHFFGELAGEAVAQKEAGIGRVADAKMGNRLFSESAPGEILSGARTLGALQAFLKKCG